MSLMRMPPVLQSPLAPIAPIPSISPATPRLITYYQTHHDGAGNHISILPLVTQPGIHITHVNLAALHINEDPAHLTLNDHVPSHPRFDTLWAELRVLQATDIKVLAMLGGAAQGTYARLDGDAPSFERYYRPLRDLLLARQLDGVDLDVEEEMSLAGIIRLIDRLRADFGPTFLLTLAPVATALLSPVHNLSGFDYVALERARGRDIAWYHAQFYCGWGSCANPFMYEMIVRQGWPAERIVAGLLTSPENGHGWVPFEVLAGVLPGLVARHPGFAGVMGWEYFNSMPGGRDRPWEWARRMTGLLRGEKAAGNGGEHGGPDDTEPDDGRLLVLEADPDREGGREAPLPEAFEYHSAGGGSDSESEQP